MGRSYGAGIQQAALFYKYVAAARLERSLGSFEAKRPAARVPSTRHLATTPTFAMVPPLVIEGTAQIYKTTPATGARASNVRLPR